MKIISIHEQQDLEKLCETFTTDTEIQFDAGTYRLESPLIFSQCHYQIVITGVNDTIISGCKKISLQWHCYNQTIKYADLMKDEDIDGLFINGKRYMMARYPNYDANIVIWNGYSSDCLSDTRVAAWENPTGGYIHAMHSSMWGDMHYKITGKDESGHLMYEGGWQNNRPMGMHGKYRYVENIFEELNTPGEYYYDANTRRLYVCPYDGVLGDSAEVITNSSLIQIINSENVTIRGIAFAKTSRTFMQTKEPLLRSDWRIYRGGAVYYKNAANCLLEDCEFSDIGSNAIFVDGNCNNINIRGCKIAQIGASGVCFVGRSDSVRNPLFEYEKCLLLEEIDKQIGPQNDQYPKNCTVEDCLMYQTGRIEKQSAGVQISMSMSITVRHCSIYEVPRAGINISEGTFGGHIIEYCDIFDTVKETGDHGSFNSWGRDRYWNVESANNEEIKQLSSLDVLKPNIIRNNRFKCENGWDIDLDDGSSYYEIYNNLCLNGGIKLREGFCRKVFNNITVNNSIHQHVWYENSGDMLKNNIVFEPFKPVHMPKNWDCECDYNILHDAEVKQTQKANSLMELSNKDEHSLCFDCMFTDPAKGDYTVTNPDAMKCGYVNFNFNFGVTSPTLKHYAKIPEMPEMRVNLTEQKSDYFIYHDILMKNIETEGEMSVYGTPGKSGVLVLEISNFNEFFSLGIRVDDVILTVNGNQIEHFDSFEEEMNKEKNTEKLNITLLRKQKVIKI